MQDLPRVQKRSWGVPQRFREHYNRKQEEAEEMAKIDRVQEIALADLKPYANNAKEHSPEQVELIARSIAEFGFLSPILIDNDKNIIAGHGRAKAGELLGLKTVPAVFIEGLTPEQYRAYVLADNKLTELGSWNMAAVNAELEALADADFEIDLTGFNLELEENESWFDTRERFDTSSEGESAEYQEFLEKFEQKKTTDDCYTPDNVYEAVKAWACKEYGIKEKDIIRPFCPGGDYEKENYKKGAVVLDNPPFSILTDILKFYLEKNIKFILFCPTVSAFTSVEGVCSICLSTQVTYENGACVNTSFMTNLEPGTKARSAPDLNQAILDADKVNRRLFHREIGKYVYPPECITSAQVGKYSKYGVNFRVKADACLMVPELDSQKAEGKSIYGRGLLLSEAMTEENKKAEANAEAEKLRQEREKPKSVWEISEREREIIRGLNNGK